MSHLAPRLLVLTLVSVITLMIPACQGAVCNQSGWFGKDSCQYKCHCANGVQCDFTIGECSAGCAMGWFGPQCQYVDLTSTESTISTPSWLYDGNDNTCNTETNVQTVTIQLKDPLPVTWLRLYVNNPGNVGAFTLTFRPKTGDNSVTCNNMKIGSFNDKTLDIHCDMNVQVQKLILTGNGVKSLCSVYISGGRNVALKQSVSQSTTWQSYGAARAVDGNTDNNFGHGSCTQTQNLDFDPNWDITFPLPQMINRYILYNRQDDHQARLQYFILSSFDGTGSQVFQYQDPLSQPQSIYTITSTTSISSIKRIKIQATHPEPDSYPPVLTLCEVEAYGDAICENGKYGRECEQNCDHCLNNKCFCSTGWCINGCVDGYFGYTCDKPCGANCVVNTCEQNSGTCSNGCKDGYIGITCENACPPKTYGKNCAQTCSTNCTDQKCNHINGKCDLCLPGKMGDKCDQVCQHPNYGQNCSKTCSVNCKDQKCNKVDGTCFGCIDGKTGNQCDQDCPATYYGQNCTQRCSTNCVDRLCDKVTGVCDICHPGKMGNQCDQDCPHPMYGLDCLQTCSTHCVDQNCDLVYGTCDQCYPGTIGDQCNQICPDTTYGQDCKMKCSLNCADQICNRVNGICDRCVVGKIGEQCSHDCPHPKYGQDCLQTCSTQCVDQNCDLVYGTCDQCYPGTIGDQCNQICPDKTYGEGCKQTCSVYCINEICDPVNGTCAHCVAGKLGDKCDQDCPATTYGLDCKATCSVNCVNQFCDTITGKCINCPPGKRGEQCEEECPPGKYGRGCTQTCNKNCYINATHNVACNIDTGICLQGCFSGYTGLQCESKMSEDSSTDLAVGAGIGVGVTFLVCIIGISVYCYWRRSSRVVKARRQRPPGYEETVMNGQDEHQYRELFKSSDGYNLPTDATSAELSTPRSRSRITVTENTTAPYMNADVGHYEDITEIGNMDGATGDTVSIGDVTTTLEKGRNNDGYMYANC